MPDTYTRSGLAIINPYGGIWTDKIFPDAHEALKYLRDYWGNERDLREYKLAYASLEVKLHDEHMGPVYVPIPNGDRGGAA